jgi:hypothetical protein
LLIGQPKELLPVPSRRRLTRTSLAVAIAVSSLGVLAAACGDDDSTAPTPTPAASGPACEPVGAGGGAEIAVTLDEWSVVAEPATASAGAVTFGIANEGAEPHELVVVRAASPDALIVVEGKVDEDALPDGAFVGEVEGFPAGEACEGTFELTAGTYVLFCNIVEEHDGEREGHFTEGMATTFVVT